MEDRHYEPKRALVSSRGCRFASFPATTETANGFCCQRNLLDMTRDACHSEAVIRSWKNAATRRFAESGKSRWSGMDDQRAALRLNQLDAAKALDDLGRMRSIGLHKLSGDRAGAWAVTINGPWRLVFRFDAGDAFDVEIVDYH